MLYKLICAQLYSYTKLGEVLCVASHLPLITSFTWAVVRLVSQFLSILKHLMAWTSDN